MFYGQKIISLSNYWTSIKGSKTIREVKNPGKVHEKYVLYLRKSINIVIYILFYRAFAEQLSFY